MTASVLDDNAYDKCDEASPAYSAEFAAAYADASNRVSNEYGVAALEYLRRGVAVIALKEGSKVPATRHGVNDWTDNPASVTDWWANRRLNVGGALGQVSRGIVAIDLDVHDGAGNGLETLKAWETEHGRLPETWRQETGSGGQQLFYRCDREIRNSTCSELGVDIRGDGGYVVLPPSLHPNGERYEWLCSPDDMDVAEADVNVYALIDYVARNGRAGTTSESTGKFRLPDKVKSGERNDTLFKYAAHLRAIGRSDEEMLNSVMGANFTRCDPPLDSRDVERIVRSAARYQQGDGSDESEEPLKRQRRQDGPEEAHGGGRKKKLAPNVLGRMIIAENHACVIDGAPAVWTGRRWEFGTTPISRLALELDDEQKKQDKSEVVSYVQDKAPCVSSDATFDGHCYVQFSDVTFDVTEERVVDPTPEMFITGTISVPLDLSVGRNFADEFIESLAGGDDATATVMREIIGACMCSSRIISQSPMLVGRAGGGTVTASNGKSTYLNMLHALLGTRNVSSLDITTLGERFQAGRIVGKLANLGDDIPNDFLRGSELSTFKKLVTGDVIYSDVKNARGFEFRPNATLIFSMNEVPRMGDTSEGVYRRLAFVPFRNSFTPDTPGFDPNISRKLAQPEVMARMAVLGLEALPDLIDRGRLTEIPDMAAEVEKVRAMNDPATDWIEDQEIDPFKDIDGRSVAAVYGEFVKWYEDTGGKFRMTNSKFTRRIKEYYARRGVIVVTELRRNDSDRRPTKHYRCQNSQLDI